MTIFSQKFYIREVLILKFPNNKYLQMTKDEQFAREILVN